MSSHESLWDFTRVSRVMSREWVVSTRVWHVSFLRVIGLSHICDPTLPHVGDMTHPYVRYDSSICQTWLIRMCDLTHSYVRRDSFIFLTWLLHMRKNSSIQYQSRTAYTVTNSQLNISVNTGCVAGSWKMTFTWFVHGLTHRTYDKGMTAKPKPLHERHRCRIERRNGTTCVGSDTNGFSGRASLPRNTSQKTNQRTLNELNWTQRMRGHGQIGRRGPCPLHGPWPRPALKNKSWLSTWAGHSEDSPIVRACLHQWRESFFQLGSIPIERAFLPRESTNSEILFERAYQLKAPLFQKWSSDRRGLPWRKDTLQHTPQHTLQHMATQTVLHCNSYQGMGYGVWGMWYGVATTVAQ